MFLFQTRSAIITITGIENPSAAQVYECFCGKLAEYKDKIQGLRSFNYKENQFLVTFEKHFNQYEGTYRDVVLAICRQGYEAKTGIFIKATKPRQPADIITLFPVPFEMEANHIFILEKRNWGQIEKIDFCTLKGQPRIKNGYVNLHIQNANYMTIGSKVNILGHWMEVTTPYNRHLPKCRYCRERGHEIRDCPKIKYQNWKREQIQQKSSTSSLSECEMDERGDIEKETFGSKLSLSATSMSDDGDQQKGKFSEKSPSSITLESFITKIKPKRPKKVLKKKGNICKKKKDKNIVSKKLTKSFANYPKRILTDISQSTKIDKAILSTTSNKAEKDNSTQILSEPLISNDNEVFPQSEEDKTAIQENLHKQVNEKRCEIVEEEKDQITLFENNQQETNEDPLNSLFQQPSTSMCSYKNALLYGE